MLDELLATQCGVVSRVQVLAAGVSAGEVRHRLARGRWQRLFAGVYAAFTGPLPRCAQLWAVLLRVGGGAVLSHETAAELAGLLDRPAAVIHVTVPGQRHPRRLAGVVIHRCEAMAQRRHPSRLPPQTRVDDTVLDLVDASRDADDALAWLARAVGSRVTTADRLAVAARDRRKLRYRSLVDAALADVGSGSHSIAELRYLRDVERGHGLPVSHRQLRRAGGGSARYDDVRYLDYRTRVELDGRAAHPDHARWRDMHRDNAAVLDGDNVLRYGLADLIGAPCHVAGQVAEVLRANGWTGRPRRCRRRDCSIR